MKWQNPIDKERLKWAAEEGRREEKNMFEKNVSLQKLMYMIVYDTLKNMFWKYLKKEEKLE